jgi:hypothetical protein
MKNTESSYFWPRGYLYRSSQILARLAAYADAAKLHRQKDIINALGRRTVRLFLRLRYIRMNNYRPSRC